MSGPSSAVFAACAFALLAGCATPSPVVVDNHRGRMRMLPREELSFSHLDQSGVGYAVRHLRAPPSPGFGVSVAGDGGEIVGQVCGAQVRFQVEQLPDHVELRGAVDQSPALLRVVEQGGQRMVSGAIGERSVWLSLAAEGLWSGGALVQGAKHPAIAAVATLPAAPLGVILPLGGCLGS